MTDAAARPPLRTIATQWGRIGCIGFGGPPTHIALLRQLCVERRQMDHRATSSRTRSRRATCCPARRRPSSRSSPPGASPGRPARSSAASRSSCRGWCIILGLAALFLATSPPTWVLGAGAGAGAAVAAVAVRAGTDLVRPSLAARRRTLAVGRSTRSLGGDRRRDRRAVARRRPARLRRREVAVAPSAAHRARRALLAPARGDHHAATGGVLALVWVAFKVGALSYGGGFVIIPLMQARRRRTTTTG